MSTLKEKLDAFKKEFLSKVTDEIVSVVATAGSALAETVPGRSTPAVGSKLPPFSLVGASGATVTSDQLIADGPLVVTFFRGMW